MGGFGFVGQVVFIKEREEDDILAEKIGIASVGLLAEGERYR